MKSAWADLLFTLSRDANTQALALIVVVSLILTPLIASALRRWQRRSRKPRTIYRRAAFPRRPRDHQSPVLIEDAPEESPSRPNSVDLSDPAVQVGAIADCDFERVPLLNRAEARLLPLLERVVKEAGDGHRLITQTSLGELIRPVEDMGTPESRRRGYASINSKRLDFAIINRFGYLVAAVEYQGSGHYHRQSFIRDAVKREALRKAGVETLEIPKRFDPADVRMRLLALIGADRPSAQTGT